MRRRLILAAVLAVTPFVARAAFENDGAWAAGSWASTSWADGAWAEDGGDPPGDTTGALSTTFTSSAVPDTAVFLRGTAYTPAGSRYVAECSPPTVVYNSGIAHKADGAMCIDPGETIDVELAGWALTNDGEVVAEECAPEYYVNGIPRDGTTFAVCMTEVD